jgi:hypothetical protein
MADEIIAKDESTGSYRAPEGQFLGVAVDVVDLGMVRNAAFDKMQHKCALVFQIDEINPDTKKRYEIAERFTVSMNEKARLRQFLGSWRGKSYTDEEAREGAPLHKLVGVPALLQIEHRQGANGKVYANISSIMRAPKGVTIHVEAYTRSPHWKKQDAPPPDEAPAPEYDGEYEDDLIPF